MASLRDVAKEAQVSISTVSRVLNGAKNVNEQTRLRVENAIKKLKYQPNRVARRLRVNKGQSNLLGVLIPDIRNPFYIDVIQGIESVTAQHAFAFLMSNFSQDPAKEGLYLDIMLSESVDGLIVAPAHEEDPKIVSIVELGVPVVCIDRALKNLEVDSVVVNNRKGAYDAVNYLIQLGHEKIGFICGPLSIPTYRERLNGYREALTVNNLPYREEYVWIGDSSVDSGKLFTQKMLAMKQPPTALFTGNNLITLGALEVLHKNHVHIPDDVSVVGFDDMYWSISLNPPLTAVSQPGYEIGRRAAELMFLRMQEPERPAVQVVLNTQLKVRDSCAPLK